MITKYRARIDEIDDEMVELFVERMSVAKQIADYKKDKGLPILDRSREEEKLQALSEKTPDDFKEYIRLLYENIMEYSKDYQKKQMLTLQ